MCVPGALVHVSLNDRAATARFIDDRHGHRHELMLLHDLLHDARRAVDAAARRDANEDLNGLRRRPRGALRECSAATKEREDECDELQPTISVACDVSDAAVTHHEISIEVS